MNLLSSLLPGIRELRTPLISGFAWLAVIYLVFRARLPVSADLVALFPGKIGNLDVAALGIPILIVGSAYVLGLVASSLISPILAAVGRRASRRLLHFARVPVISDLNQWRDRRPQSIVRFVRRMELDSWPLSGAGRNLLIDTVDRRLGDVGVPGAALIDFPRSGLLPSLSSTSAQLAQTSPTQYQEFDRVRSESQLRQSIALPIAILGFIIPIGSTWILGVAGLITAGVMLIQSIQHSRQAYDALANAAYLGIVDIPTIQSIITAIGKMDPKPTNPPEWSATLVAILDQAAQFDLADTMVHRMASGENEKYHENYDEALRVITDAERYDQWRNYMKKLGNPLPSASEETDGAEHAN